MKDFNFRLWNKILGWLVFAIALYTFASTVEPTASFWDPGEYISTSAKLEVGHPPGAPLFQMMGAFFSTFAPDQTDVALMVNMMSVFSSAFAILFMFWSISLLVRKISGPIEKMSPGNKMAVLGSALVGSLAFTFSDSFWFNAVEAEVYAMAMCFMAALFYVGLLWERDMFKARGNRWLILLAFIIGLSFGVHFMALLAIPSIGYLYYFKNTEKITVKNFITATIGVVGILLFIFKLLLPYSLSFFAASEVFFINGFGMPFDSGTVIAALVLIAIFYFGLKYTRKKNFIQINTALLCILFIFIGFSCWVMLPIRANAGTTINENSPENAQELLAYYNRDQYPSNPLFYGPQYTAAFAGLDKNEPYKDDVKKYEENDKTGKYEIVNNWKNGKQNSDSKQKTILPRMWDQQSTNHIVNYMNLTGPVNFHVKPENLGDEQLVGLVRQVKAQYAQGKMGNDGLTRFLKQYGQDLVIEKPSTTANFQFFFQFQVWYMYFRYFMWNFSGRQDDVQGKYTNQHGNWMSGIPFVDSHFFGSQKNLPDAVKNNPARNTYFFLPLILGLIGLFFQYDRDKANFWVLLVLFLFTGIALKIYLNERAFEPRERDYALVGSFYVFAIWIGFGVYSIYDKLKKYITPKVVAPIITAVCLLAVPVLMAQQNWDDHDRSGKRTATALAKNYLDSVDENGILFTIGDNDTFPLWYVQEVEGYRTDVRIINTSLFATSWYIDQMKRASYESKPVKTMLQHKNYRYGTNDQVFYNKDPRLSDTLDVKTWLKYIMSDNQSTQVTFDDGQTYNLFPTKHLRLPVNKKNALKYGIVNEKDKNKIVSSIPINLKGRSVVKNTLLMLDVVANTDWKRPIYFSGGSFNDSDYLWMKDYLELDGLCYKLVPIKTKLDSKNPYSDMGRIDVDKMYNLVMNWHWGNSGDPNMYYDVQTRQNSISYRSNMIRLVQKLIEKHDYKRAKNILDLGMEKMPVDKFGHYVLLDPFIIDYYKIDETKKARKIWKEVATVYQQRLNYFSALSYKEQQNSAQRIYNNLEDYRDLVDIVVLNDSDEMAKKKAEEFNSYVKKFKNFYRGSGDIDVNQEQENAQEPSLPETIQ